MKLVKKIDAPRWQLDLRDAVRDLRMVVIPRKGTKEEKDAAKKYIKELQSLTRSLSSDIEGITIA